jgi:hypothetical protein
MRPSVFLFCMSCLVFCLLLLCGITISTGRHSKQVSESQVAHNPIAPDLLKSDKPDERPVMLVTDSGSDVTTLIQQIKDALNSSNPNDLEMIFTNQVLALIKADPWTAAHFAETLPDGLLRTDVMRVTVENWSKSDPSEAAKWVSQLVDSNQRDTMLSCLCFQVAQTDTGMAIQILEQQGVDDERRKAMLGNLAQQLASQNLQGALAWAGNYVGEDKDDLVAQIALAESKTDPAAAALIISQQISPGPVQNETALSIVNQWAQTDTAAATSWVDEFPAGEVRDKATFTISSIAAYQAAQGTPTP